MELKEVLLKRRSVRKFTAESVSDEMIEELLHAAMSGPSACNKKPWEFYVVTNEEKLEELKGASKFTKFSAKLAIIVCGNLSHALPMHLADYWIQDCSAAAENILLRVTDLGLGAVWCGIHPLKISSRKSTKLTKSSRTTRSAACTISLARTGSMASSSRAARASKASISTVRASAAV